MGLNVQKIADALVYSASQIPSSIGKKVSSGSTSVANGAKKLGGAMESLAAQGKAHALKFVENHPSKLTSAIESSYNRGKDAQTITCKIVSEVSDAITKTADGKKPVFTSKTLSPDQLVDFVTGPKAKISAAESAKTFIEAGKTKGELTAWKAELLQKHAQKFVK